MTVLHSNEKLTLANELIYELKVKDAMSKNLIFFSKEATFREIQSTLKKHKITGVPILDEKKNVIGIISVNNVINALDKGYANEKVKNYITTNVITIPKNYSLVSAIKKFEKYKFGRLPVTENTRSNRIVGILTMGDILKCLLVSIQSIAEEAEKKEDDNTQLTKKMIRQDKQKKLRFEVKKADFDNAGQVASIIRNYLQRLDIDKRILRRVAIVCYEAEMNISIHSLGGHISVEVEDSKITIIASDYGPGIPDIEEAMRPGYTTASEQIRALGFGAGMGLCNIKRCSDHFEIESSMETGTILKSIINLGGQK
ncbi:MAG: CBS domain-containing protein [Candidatus Caldatribacteriota bacterium]|nr:CBS domain-containing protein [Atribacterota bacterium]MDD4344309.1 CBS domain-containing protein [Eubacteriales bacterium]MDD4765269.1 CBS domain-containing protein [Atribacterota bacterium]MDD5636042.1 CBS domain-containing protein [Atribacterota bacterium]MDI9597428.1 CBS domain-containing protein [Atribacterota bacterium]